jgi:hypothetical protein
MTSIPIASPIPYTGENDARVPDMLKSPEDADVPTADIEANTGMTTKRTANAIRANSGTIMRPMF